MKYLFSLAFALLLMVPMTAANSTDKVDEMTVIEMTQNDKKEKKECSKEKKCCTKKEAKSEAKACSGECTGDCKKESCTKKESKKVAKK